MQVHITRCFSFTTFNVSSTVIFKFSPKMEGRSLSLVLLLFALAHLHIARCSPYLQPFERGNRLDGYSPLKLESSQKLIKEMCQKNGGDAAYDNLMIAKNQTEVCVDGVFSSSEMRNAYQKIMRNWDLSIAFNYCKKLPELNHCTNKIFTALEPCLAKSERAAPNIIQKRIYALLDFLCLNEGDDAILFAFKGGIGCLYEKKNPIESCVKNTSAFKKYSESTELVFNLEQECQGMHEVQVCIVKELKTCEATNPAIYIESSFNFVNKQAPCSNALMK